MTVSKKLYLGSATALVATVCMGLSAWLGIGSVGGKVAKLINVNAKKVYLSGDIMTAATEIVTFEQAVILAASRHDANAISLQDAAFRTTIAQIQRDIELFVPLIETEEGRRHIAELRAARAEMMATHQILSAATREKDGAAIDQIFQTKVMPVAGRMKKTAETLSRQQEQLMHDVGANTSAAVAQQRSLVGTILLVAMATGFGLMWVIKKLNGTVVVAVDEMTKSSEQVKLASEQIATSSQRLAEASCEQAASIEETSASTEEIGSMTRRNSENSKSAAKLVDQSVQGFARSNRLLDEMLSAMEGISDSSDKISRIIKVIDEIAFQTNILALNAAVEAARAGEAGMGFAVVADEVRNLAQRCAQAAKDTATLIEDSIAKSRDGKSKVSETATSIRSVSEQAIQIKTLVDEVTLGSVEQTRGIEQISKALSQMDQATQSAAANAEESASAARELDSQAEALHGAIDRVHLMFSETTGHMVAERVQKSPRPMVTATAPRKRAAREFASNLSALHSVAGSSIKPSARQNMRQTKEEFPLEESFTEF